MSFKTNLLADNQNLFLMLSGKAIVKFDRDTAQRVCDKLKRWGDGYGATDGNVIGINGITRFVGTDKFLTVFYNGVPILRLNHDQCRRFCARIQAWIDEPKMRPQEQTVDKIIREIRQAERELRENGKHMDIADTG